MRKHLLRLGATSLKRDSGGQSVLTGIALDPFNDCPFGNPESRRPLRPALRLAFDRARQQWADEMINGLLNAHGRRFVGFMAAAAAEDVLRPCLPHPVARRLACVIGAATYRSALRRTRRSWPLLV